MYYYANFLIVLLYCAACCDITNAQGTVNFYVEKFYACEDVPNQKMNLTVVPKSFTPGRQVVDISFFTPIPLGSQLRFGMVIELEIPLKPIRQWQNLLSFEDDFCRTTQIYLGELVYELETAIAIPRGSCPIPRGHYHAMNYTMDYTKMKLQNYPPGRFRTTLRFFEKPNRNVALCSTIISANKI